MTTAWQRNTTVYLRRSIVGRIYLQGRSLGDKVELGCGYGHIKKKTWPLMLCLDLSQTLTSGALTKHVSLLHSGAGASRK